MPVGAPFSAPETNDAFAVVPAAAMAGPLPVWSVIWPAPAAVVAADAWVLGTMAWPAVDAALWVVAGNAEAPSVCAPGPEALASRTDGSMPRPATPAKALSLHAKEASSR